MNRGYCVKWLMISGVLRCTRLTHYGPVTCSTNVQTIQITYFRGYGTW